MPTYEFPSLGFDPAPGDPAAVDQAAQATKTFADRLATDVATLRRMQSSSWVGDAGNAFRENVKDLPEDLDKSRAAYQQTAQVLVSFVSTLTNAQRRARQLEQEAAEAIRQQRIAADNANQLNHQASGAQSPAREQIIANANSWVSRANSFTSRLGELRQQARALQQDLAGQADQAAGRIRSASSAPYHEPHWWEKAWNGFMDWVRENADVLRQISGILKIASAICALLSFIPVVGVFFGTAALVLGGISIAIDVALKLATGEGSWWAIGADAALTFLPIGRILKGAGGFLGRTVPGFATAVERMGAAVRPVVNGVKQIAFQASRLLPRTRAFERMAAEVNNLPAAIGRWRVGNNPAAAVTAAERRLQSLVTGGQTPAQAWSALSAAEKSAIRGVQRTRFWRNVSNSLDNDADFARRYGSMFDDADRAAMARGNAPRTIDPVTGENVPYQLSHEVRPGTNSPGAISQGSSYQVPRTQWQHHNYDPNGWKYPDETYLQDWLRSGRGAPVIPTGAGATPDQPQPAPAR